MSTTILPGLLLVGGPLAVALLMNLVISRRVTVGVLKEHNEVAGAFIHVVGGIYGILLAFVVSVVWEHNDDARRTAAAEANSAATLVRLSEGMPAPEGTRLRDETVAYVHGVIEDEWPLMRKGRSSELVAREIADMWRTVTTFEPKTEGQKNVHVQVLADMGTLADQRRSRLFESRRRMPPLVWATIIVGGVIVLGLGGIHGLRFMGSKALMMASLALSMGIVALTIWDLGRPFSGATAISAEDYRKALDVVRDVRPLANDPPP